MKHLIILIFIFGVGILHAQSETSFSISGVVHDSLNNTTLPFVSIHKSRDRKGTITDFEGLFTLDQVLPGDTIVCSYIGFKSKRIIADRNMSNAKNKIYLNREDIMIEEVIVMADNSILYELLSKASKKKPATNRVAKTYFELETFSGNEQLELFQGYYNGSYNGYNVSNLELKNAHFALAPISKRIFASTETSKAMYLHKLLSANDYFPTSPFELNKRKLRKSYQLALSSKFKDEKGNVIYAINFKPRQSENQFFEGRVWVDSLTSNINKVQLRIKNTAIHPFRSLWEIHTLGQVDLDITKTFTPINGEITIKSIDFNYKLLYTSKEDPPLNIETRAVLWAYNYRDAFNMPLFNFTQTSNYDYRRIQMLPENSEFWKCNDEFKMENNNAKRQQFISDSSTINNYQLFNTDTITEQNFFESPYITWKGNRIIFKGISKDSSEYYDKKGVIRSQRYNLDVQFFVDINELCDSIQIISKTIFDPYTSFYHFETTKESQAFINIYFDLMELERRKMHQQLLKCNGDLEQIKKCYNDAKVSAKKLSDSYLKEVERGTNLTALQKWNELICEKLEIDTFYMFEIEVEDDK